MVWRDIDLIYDWLNKFYSCYMATVAVNVNGHGLTLQKLKYDIHTKIYEVVTTGIIPKVGMTLIPWV